MSELASQTTTPEPEEPVTAPTHDHAWRRLTAGTVTQAVEYHYQCDLCHQTWIM